VDSFILGAGVCAIDFFMLYCLARSLIFQDVCSGVLGRVGLLLLKYIFICATYMYILVFLDCCPLRVVAGGCVVLALFVVKNYLILIDIEVVDK